VTSIFIALRFDSTVCDFDSVPLCPLQRPRRPFYGGKKLRNKQEKTMGGGPDIAFEKPPRRACFASSSPDAQAV
jgi:hypothetical protein